MAKILGTSIGKTSSIIFLVLVVFISLALSNVSFLVSKSVAGPPLRLEGMKEGSIGWGGGINEIPGQNGSTCAKDSDCVISTLKKCGKKLKCI
jgi:hypothetical protein